MVVVKGDFGWSDAVFLKFEARGLGLSLGYGSVFVVLSSVFGTPGFSYPGLWLFLSGDVHLQETEKCPHAEHS